jgi:hypothetical protein
VILKVAPRIAPGATEAKVTGPDARAVQPAGSETERRTFSVAPALVVGETRSDFLDRIRDEAGESRLSQASDVVFRRHNVGLHLVGNAVAGWPAVITPS